MDADEVRRLAKRSPKEHLEMSFLRHWHLLFAQLPGPVRQYVFCPGRKWAFDFAWPDENIKLAVEIQGGAYMQRSGHNTASGQTKDYEKWRMAARLGWRVLPFSTVDMKHAADVVQEVAEILCKAE